MGYCRQPMATVLPQKIVARFFPKIKQIWNYFDEKGCNLDLLTWHKTNPIPTCNNSYLNDTEYLIFAREKGVKVYGTYHTKKKYYVSKANVADKKLYEHPTIKPLEIIKNLVINSSSGGGHSTRLFYGQWYNWCCL